MRIRPLLALPFAALTAVGMLVAAPPALAADGRIITIAGDLQSELGSPADWHPACDASQLHQTGADTYSATFALPAGSYEFKVTVNNSWDENYGAGGVRDGANIPLVIG